MKKLIIVSTLLLGGAGGYALATSDTIALAEFNFASIKADEAKQIAKDKVNGEIIDFDYEREGKQSYYEVEVVNDTEKVELRIDAETGDVTIIERESMVKDSAKKQNDNGDFSNDSTDNDDEKDDFVNGSTDNNGEKNEFTKQEKSVLTAKQAIDIALQQAPGTIADIELENGVFSVEIKNGVHEYDVKIDASTGEVLLVEKEIDF